MYQIKFTLKQHTPIIHFQHDQAGATLRATEVKPKLDRFILTKLGSDNYEGGRQQAQQNGWLIDKDKGALDYKMRIESEGEKSYYLPLSRFLNKRKCGNLSKEINIDFEFIMPSSYFGNEDKFKFHPKTDDFDAHSSNLENLKFGIKSDRIIITLLTLDSDLKLKLENCINEFFLSHNFGTRQDKGFGSFAIDKSLIGNITLNNNKNLIKNLFVKKKTLITTPSQSDIFKTINEDYQLLKSGINQPEFNNQPGKYEKSELFKYFLEKDIRWEKRKIKQHLNENKVTLVAKRNLEPIDYDVQENEFYNDYDDKQNNQYRYIRALLGLAEHYEFDTSNIGRLKVKITHIPQNNQDKIERFQSPVFFKVIDNVIYLGIDNSYNNILDKQFEFKPDGVKAINIETPSSFDLKDFIENHFNSVNWRNI